MSLIQDHMVLSWKLLDLTNTVWCSTRLLPKDHFFLLLFFFFWWDGWGKINFYLFVGEYSSECGP